MVEEPAAGGGIGTLRADVAAELAVVRAWRDVQPPSDTRDAMVAGFLWALALVADVPVLELRARLDDAPAPTVPAAPAVSPPAAAVPETVPWPGLGIARIDRAHVAGDGPPARARAFTAGPDGRPVAIETSYAEMAADEAGLARDLSDDTAAPETGVDVLVDTTK